MTDPTSNKAASAAPAPGAKKAWARPALARMSGCEAENGATPAVNDGGFSSGS